MFIFHSVLPLRQTTVFSLAPKARGQLSAWMSPSARCNAQRAGGRRTPNKLLEQITRCSARRGTISWHLAMSTSPKIRMRRGHCSCYDKSLSDPPELIQLPHRMRKLICKRMINLYDFYLVMINPSGATSGTGASVMPLLLEQFWAPS